MVSPVISNSLNSPLLALQPETWGFGDLFCRALCALSGCTHTWGHMPRGLRGGQGSEGPHHRTGHNSSCWSEFGCPRESQPVHGDGEGHA